MDCLVSPGGSVIDIAVGDAVQWVFEHPGLFSLSDVEVEFARSHGRDGIDSVIDKVLAQGWVLISETAGGDVAAIMWEEKPEPLKPSGLAAGHGYRMILAWIAAKSFEPRRRILIKVRRTGQLWYQTAEALLRGYQYARNPDRALPCPGCGAQVSKEETVMRQRCPRCGTDLA